MAVMSKPTFSQRFWNRVAVGPWEECWEWKAAMAGAHGRNPRGAIKKNGKMFQAHRIAYEERFGPIPGGLLVRHKCDNGLCCNPEHLETGTHQDNCDDMWRRGRQGVVRAKNCCRGDRHWTRLHPDRVFRGERNPNLRLTDAQVEDLKAMWATGSYNKAQIARHFGVWPSTVARILSGAIRGARGTSNA